LITRHVKKLRKPLEGKPDILIRNGEIDTALLSRSGLDFDKLRAMLRAQDIFSISGVAYTIYETNGTLSVLRKSRYDGVTRQDLNLPDRELRLPCSLVENGVICRENLQEIGRDEDWLRRRLQDMGYLDIQSVTCAETTETGELAVIARAYMTSAAAKSTTPVP
jgi:uncharacterized membrane protein YcaP (DUF421 family)